MIRDGEVKQRQQFYHHGYTICHPKSGYVIIIIIMEAFIKRRIPGKTTCSKALQYNSNKVVIKLKLY